MVKFLKGIREQSEKFKRNTGKQTPPPLGDTPNSVHTIPDRCFGLVLSIFARLRSLLDVVQVMQLRFHRWKLLLTATTNIAAMQKERDIFVWTDGEIELLLECVKTFASVCMSLRRQELGRDQVKI